MKREFRLSVSSILVLIAFQIVYGMAVFYATRHFYQRQPEVAAASAGVRQTMRRASPHDLPSAGSSKEGVLLPGSERITVSDVQQLLTGNPDAGSPTSAAESKMNPEELSRIADGHFRERRFREAAIEYARVLEQAPDNVDIYNNLGLTLHYLGRSREALGVLEDGIAVDGEYQRIWLTFGFVQQGVGDLDAARIALTRAAELDANSGVGREATRLLSLLPE